MSSSSAKVSKTTSQTIHEKLPKDVEYGAATSNDTENINSKATERSRPKIMWDRFNGVDNPKIGFMQSLKAIMISSYLNFFLIFIPLAWVSHFVRWHFAITFAFCFLAIVPLEKLFEWGGDQMAIYLGLNLGDLLIVSLDNAVEATLAIILLRKCELRVLQSTIVGVVLLHLLLIPGTSFLIGGSTLWEQHLHPHMTQVNNSLLAIGVLSLLVPTAFFSALDTGGTPGNAADALITTSFRNQFLMASRGTAVVLLIIYIASRIFIADPPGEDNAGMLHPDAPEAFHEAERDLAERKAEVNSWICVGMLVVTIAIMAVTAEFLVESIEVIRSNGHITQEWFGIILLPIVSYSADGMVAIGYFLRSTVQRVFGYGEPSEVPSELAKARSIDLSIQFTLFWMPFIVLLAWWTNSALSLLFDLYEVALLLGSTFLVNYVTQDSKTNWVEGVTLVGFYIMIALWTWFYTGQPQLATMLSSGRCIVPVA